MTVNRTLGTTTALVLGLGLTALPAEAEAPAAVPPAASQAAPVEPLTNLDHLDFLGDTAAPRELPRHTTYRLAQEPDVGMLWTYADRRETGFERIGGGALDPETGPWCQGGCRRRRRRPRRRRESGTGGRPATTPAASAPTSCSAGSPTCRPPTARRRQRRALDAAGQHPQPQRGPRRQPDPATATRPTGSPAPSRRSARRSGLPRRRPAVRPVLERRSRSRWRRSTGRYSTATAATCASTAARCRRGSLSTAPTPRRRPSSGSPPSSTTGHAPRPTRDGAARRGRHRALRRRRPPLAVRRCAAVGARARCGTPGPPRWAPPWSPPATPSTGRDCFRSRSATRSPRPVTAHLGEPTTADGPPGADRVQVAYRADSRVQGLPPRRPRRDLLAGVQAAWTFSANAAREPATTPPPAPRSTASRPTAA